MYTQSINGQKNCQSTYVHVHCSLNMRRRITSYSTVYSLILTDIGVQKQKKIIYTQQPFTYKHAYLLPHCTTEAATTYESIKSLSYACMHSTPHTHHQQQQHRVPHLSHLRCLINGLFDILIVECLRL